MSYDEQPDPLQESYQEYAKLEKKLAAKDAELARLRGVVEAAKYMETVLSDFMDALIQHTCGVHPDQAREQNWWELRCKGRDAKAKFRAMLAALPSPAEAGEKACGEKIEIGSSTYFCELPKGHFSLHHGEPYVCLECQFVHRLSSPHYRLHKEFAKKFIPPAAPSDAKAGERPVGQPEQMKGAEDGFPGSDY
jgi:hypothetical protein